MKIHFCEELTSLKLVNKLGDQREWIIVLYCVFIYITIVLYHLFLSILFGYKEHGGGLRTD